MRLTELEPRFLRYEVRLDGIYLPFVTSITEAQGVKFLCPLCFITNKGKIGTHAVICWSRSRGVPEAASPGPGRWTLKGTSFEDLTLDGDGGSRSALLLGGCNWHGFVTNGEIS